MIEPYPNYLQEILINRRLISDSKKLIRDFFQFWGKNSAKWPEFSVIYRILNKSLLTFANLQYIWEGPRGRGGGLWQTTSM